MLAVVVDAVESLAQQGFLALRREDPQAALALFRQSLPIYRNYPTSPGVTRGLAQLLIALSACGQPHAAARLMFDYDGSRDTPDSVFPNNWFSTHIGGHVAIYPMHAVNRRRERLESNTRDLPTDFQSTLAPC